MLAGAGQRGWEQLLGLGRGAGSRCWGWAEGLGAAAGAGQRGWEQLARWLAWGRRPRRVPSGGAVAGRGHPGGGQPAQVSRAVAAAAARLGSVAAAAGSSTAPQAARCRRHPRCRLLCPHPSAPAATRPPAVLLAAVCARHGALRSGALSIIRMYKDSLLCGAACGLCQAEARRPSSRQVRRRRSACRDEMVSTAGAGRHPMLAWPRRSGGRLASLANAPYHCATVLAVPRCHGTAHASADTLVCPVHVPVAVPQDRMMAKSRNIRLYVKRVFISGACPHQRSCMLARPTGLAWREG